MSKGFNRHSHHSSEGGRRVLQHSIPTASHGIVALVCLFVWSAAAALSYADDEGWPDWKISGFIAAFRDPAKDTRIQALRRVQPSLLSPPSKEVAPEVAQLLEDPESDVRTSAALMLGKMGEAAKAFAPQVAQLLEDSESDVRSSAAVALGKMGDAAKEFAPQVAKLLEDPDSDVRSSAASTLMVWGPFSDSDVFNRILNAAYLWEKHERRVDAYLLFGHDAQKALCISYLDDRSTGTLPKFEKFDKEEARNVINALRLGFASISS